MDKSNLDMKRMKYQHYPEKVRAEAYRLREKGLSYRKIAAKVGIPRGTIRYNLDSAVRQHAAGYYAEHAKEIAKQKADYYQDHKTEILQQKIKYNQRPEVIQRTVEYRKAHKKERAQWDATYYREHKEKMRKYYRDHASEKNANTAKRHALKNAALIGATINQLAEISRIYKQAMEASKVRCYLCGKLIKHGHRHVDHIIPLSKGGIHRSSNLAIACDTCNRKKSNKLPEKMGILL